MDRIDHIEITPTTAPSQTALPFFERRRVSRLRARQVRRLVRHFEPWSVLKVSLIFYFCLWGILLIAGVILWRFAVTAGTVGNLENFIKELFALETFSFNADQIFRFSALVGLVLVVAGSGFTVLMAVIFNLISDIIGGVRVTVVEEETARPRPKRTLPRNATSRDKHSPNSVSTHQPPMNDPPFWPSEKRKARRRNSTHKRSSRR